MRFLCFFLNEFIVLSDGSVTTCCMDPTGLNRYANIYHDDFKTVWKKYKRVVRNITEDPLKMPRCKICFDKISAAGFPETGNYKANPSDEETKDFLNSQTLPCQIVIEMSSICNLKCKGCMQSRENISSKREHPLIDFDVLSNWILGAMENIHYIRLYNYGETFVHPKSLDFIEIVKKKDKKIKIELATNGLLLNTREKRKRLILSDVDIIYFSIHGSDNQSVQRYMTSKFDFNEMMAILQDCVELKKKYNKNTCLVWKYLLFEWNDTDAHIEQAKFLSHKIGVDKLIFWLPGFPSPSKRFPELSFNSVVEVVEYK